ncbi:MAG: helix-turn-helix domain-containing protein, partial [Anaeroplasmataceae bacterium]|nr:helix-turn-helix domain-containing protein [Anaeroplasmataceae bacterium]
MILEEKIKKIREKEDLSQEAFAERLGVSRQTVINWEKGKSTPTFELLMLIANEFHIEINSLVQSDMELQYMSLEEQVNKEKSLLNKEIKPVFDSEEKPLYIPKKAFFTGDVKFNFFMMLTFLFVVGLEIWLFLNMDDWHWKWLILIFIIGFSIASLYDFVNFI